jgi:hypothetical protein
VKAATCGAVAIAALVVPCALVSQKAKTYKHVSEYQIAILDQNLRVATGSDATLAKNSTDAKLGAGGQGIHLLHTDAGDYRVEAPVNKGATLVSAMVSDVYHPAKTLHNQWFLDSVQPGTKVLFASECAKPNKKHPNQPVRCTFYFPDPDSSDHEYATIGDFTPFLPGDGSNTAKTAGTLCGTGKLKPDVEAQLCVPQIPLSAPANVPPPPIPTAMAVAPASRPKPEPPQLPAPARVVAPAVPTAMAVAPTATPDTAPPHLPITAPVTATPAPTPTAMPASSALVMASVSVESSVKGADIEVDGQFAGSTPSTLTVAAGLHTIVVKKNGYAVWSRSLNVVGNGVHLSAGLSVQPQPKTTTRMSRKRAVSVRCYPASACITSSAGSSAGAEVQ